MAAGPIRFDALRSEDVSARVARGPLFLPIGAIEQHGPHLPLGVDVLVPARLCAEAARRVGGIVCPPIAYGARSLPHSGGGCSFPGTIHVRGSVLIEYLRDVIAGYAQTGARRIVIVNGHYENEAFIFEAVELCREQGMLAATEVMALSWWSLVEDSLIAEVFGDVFPGWHTEHASLCETSLLLFLAPEDVGAERVDNPRPPRAGLYLHPADPQRTSCRGVLGNSSRSTAEIGQALFAHVSDQLEALAA